MKKKLTEKYAIHGQTSKYDVGGKICKAYNTGIYIYIYMYIYIVYIHTYRYIVIFASEGRGLVIKPCCHFRCQQGGFR